MLFILFVIGIGLFSNHKASNPNQDTAPSSTIQPTPLPLPTFSTVAEAQHEAVKRYPELGIAGSKLNSEFIARYSYYQQTRPEYLRDPSWPVRIAEELAHPPVQVNSSRVLKPIMRSSQPLTSRIDADSFLGISEAVLISRLGRPISTQIDDSPDGPFKLLQFDRTKGAETFFIIFISDGRVNSGSYRGVSTTPH